MVNRNKSLSYIYTNNKERKEEKNNDYVWWCDGWKSKEFKGWSMHSLIREWNLHQISINSSV